MTEQKGLRERENVHLTKKLNLPGKGHGKMAVYTPAQGAMKGESL